MRKKIILGLIVITVLFVGILFFIYENPSLNPDLNQENYFTKDNFKNTLAAHMRVLNKDNSFMHQDIRRIYNKEISEKEMKLEFAFSSYNYDKAEKLNLILRKLNYKSELFIKKDIYRKTIIITGWTPKLRMTETVIKNWVTTMCNIGSTYDSEFSAWIIKLDQDE
jgi:hypothetical protein